MSAPPRPPPPRGGPAPSTVPPSMATRESILRRAQEVAKAHVGGGSAEEKPHSSEWRTFFREKRSVSVRGCQFNVYLAGPEKAASEEQTPVVFCVHGGGYTGLSFALVAEELSQECAPRAFWRMAMLRARCLIELHANSSLERQRNASRVGLLTKWSRRPLHMRTPTSLLGSGSQWSRWTCDTTARAA